MALNGVFAEMMTGNLMMVSISIGTAHPVDVSGKYLRAIVAFIIGIVIGTLVLKYNKHQKQAVVGYSLMWCLLAFTMMLPFIDAKLASNYHGLFLVGLLCIAMGIHCAIIRIHGLPDLATNLMTMTLTAFVTETILLGRAHELWRRRLLSIALFVVSGILCALLITHVDPYPGLALAVLLLGLAIPCLAQEKPV